MRIAVRYDSVKVRVGALCNLVPEPIGCAMFGMPIARTIQVAQRVGVFGELAAGPATAEDLARCLGLRPAGTRLLLDALCAGGTLRLRSGRYTMAARMAKWLDPASRSYVGDVVGDTGFYWDWWAGLEQLVRDGRSVELHDRRRQGGWPARGREVGVGRRRRAWRVLDGAASRSRDVAPTIPRLW